MILITCCDVCYTPKIWTDDQERRLLIMESIRCTFCNQNWVVPLELKKEIRKRWGMFHDK